MKTRHPIIDRLEGRQLLSAAPIHDVGAVRPLFTDNSAVVFQGTAVTGKNAPVATLQMTVQKNGNGFSDQVMVTDTNDNGTADLTLSMNAAGQFIYHGTADGILELAGQMNAADTAITGTWIHSGPDGLSHGTMKLAEVSATPIPPIVTDYDGTATNQNDQVSTIGFVVTDTDGVRTAVLNINLENGGTAPVPFTITSGLTFDFKFSQPNGETDVVTGKLSANGQTITGGWKSVQADGTKGYGTVIATET